MVIQYSRRRMLAAALLPALAPAFGETDNNIIGFSPAPAPGPVNLRAFMAGGRAILPTYYPDKAALPDPIDGDLVCPADDGPGALLLADMTHVLSEEDLAGLRRPPAPVASRAFELGGYSLRLEYRADGSRSTDPDVIGHVRGEGGGLFVVRDATSPERRAAIARYQQGARDAATLDLAFNV